MRTEIPLKIKKLRLSHNYNQAYVALQIGVSRKWYGMIENGQAEAKQEHLEKMVILYKITIDELKNQQMKTVFITTIPGANSNFNQMCNSCQSEQTIAALKETVSAQKNLIKQLNEQLARINKE